jgi:hypothetical protein
MSRFLRRSPSYRPGWSSFPAPQRGGWTRFVVVAAALCLAFLLAWENIYMDQLLSELQRKKQTVENLRAQVTERKALIQQETRLALGENVASRMGLRMPEVEQVIVLAESSGLFGEQPVMTAQLSSIEHVQRRILDFFVASALARVSRPNEP